MAKIAILSGSIHKSSRLYGLIQHSQRKLEQAGFEVSTVDIAELPAEDLIRANFNSASVKEALALVEQADAVIAASPVYKASYSGVFKTFLDMIPQKGLESKILLPLFIGGSIAHLLSIDYGLKPVLSALGATNILGGVYAVDQSVSRSEDGSFELADEIVERLEAALERLSAEVTAKQPLKQTAAAG